MFQSTLPTRGSDIVLIAQGIKAVRVSIHAPHEGERRGGRRAFITPCRTFQSTLPTRGSDTIGAA